MKLKVTQYHKTLDIRTNYLDPRPESATRRLCGTWLRPFTRPSYWSSGLFVARLRSTCWTAGLRHSMPSPLCQASSARRSTLSALHLWPSGVLGRCPRDLEFTAGRSAGSSTEFQLLQATAEDDTFFLIISAFSALAVFYCRYALQI